MMSNSRTVEILTAINDYYPHAESALKATDPFQILVAVVLSAQTTDVAVNAVTPALFAALPTPAAMAAADVETISRYINRLGLYHNKARFLHGLSAQLVSRFGGQVPKTRVELTSLPGVGQKTATVTLANAFSIPGIAVDTHISRITKGFHMVPATAMPAQIQAKLERLMPQSTWINLHRALILMGRQWLTARNPQLPAGKPWTDFAKDYQPLKEAKA